MAIAAKPAQKKGGGVWGVLFWIVVGVMVAAPEAVPFLIGLAILGVAIFIIIVAQKKTPPQIAEAKRRARPASVPAPQAENVFVETARGEAPAPSIQKTTPYYPPLVDTGEIFDFDRRGVDARAHIDRVRRGDDGIHEIDVTIWPRRGQDYRTTLVTAVPMDRMNEIARGSTLAVRIDPARPGGPIFVL